MMGMEPDMSGYENIKLRAIILGLSDQKIKEMTPQIEDFAELGDFMKMPIKTYSAGMKLRLAFGIITSVSSEILLIDEIVNVGDAGFVEKAKARMKSLVYQSDIMVLSTHDMHMIREFCNKVLWLEHGKVKACGKVDDVLNVYK
jgi:ABC-type polysaccharide/polyol phosphate transport system ATPase subunit